MKIYTRTGDRGETALRGGPRVAKDDVRLEACGTVDELCALLGTARAEDPPEQIDRLLERIQNDLLTVGAELGTAATAAGNPPTIGPPHVQALEEAIDRYQATLRPLGQFVLPTGSRTAGGLNFARAVCRRAERRLVSLAHDPNQRISPSLTAYLNRLSDLLFVLARAVNAEAGRDEPAWKRDDG